jgi:sugar phosphate isomerase/epimerase
MKLAVSNIAWNPDETESAYRILADHGIHGIEAAPGILFPDCSTPLNPPAASVRHAAEQARAFGHRLVSLQAVHFGLAGASLFGASEQRSAFVGALRQAVELAAALSIGNIVLGSPRNRVRPPEIDPEMSFAVAAEALSPLAEHARACGVTIALEANPERYGTNFMTNFDDALKLCRLIGDAAFGVNYDFGERVINGLTEELPLDVARSRDVLRHVQISAPDLLPPRDCDAFLPALFDALEKVGYLHWTSVEMRRSPDAPLQALEAVIREVSRISTMPVIPDGSA